MLQRVALATGWKMDWRGRTRGRTPGAEAATVVGPDDLDQADGEGSGETRSVPEAFEQQNQEDVVADRIQRIREHRSREPQTPRLLAWHLGVWWFPRWRHETLEEEPAGGLGKIASVLYTWSLGTYEPFEWGEP